MRFAILAALVLGGAVRAGAQSALQSPGPGQCYEVQLGTWTPPLDLGEDTVFRVPPRRFRVDARPDPMLGPQAYPLRTLAGAAGPVHSRGWWSAVRQDSADIVFTTGFSGLVLHVHRDGGTWRGTASTFWDFPRQRQTAQVTLASTTCPAAQSSVHTVYDRVILGGHVMDPASGLDAVRNIGLANGRIAAITTQPVRGRDTVDARGLVVAPGFIDLHAHGQTPETYRFQSLDGVTTSLELELGSSDVAGWYRERSAGERINYGVSIGHIKVRMSVMHDSGTVMPVSDGAYRAASPAQIGEIAQRIEDGLRQGAVSVGAGFPYTPAATRDELLAVFGVAATTKTPVHVHIRPGAAGLDEALSLARETNAALHVVHINSAGLAETPVMLEKIRDARARGLDVTTEAYPYAAGMTEIQSATIQDTYRAAPDGRMAELGWPSTGERLNRESFARYSRIGGPVVVHTNTEQMVAAAINSPLTIIASDAYWQNGTGHPRTTGTFSKVLGRYVREAHSLSLMEGIRKMTIMPAQRLERRVPAMQQKGRLRVGADADITIFDAARVVDRSTYRQPSLSPVGIQHVIVNGVSVVENARAVEGVAPGKAVRGVGVCCGGERPGVYCPARYPSSIGRRPLPPGASDAGVSHLRVQQYVLAEGRVLGTHGEVSLLWRNGAGRHDGAHAGVAGRPDLRTRRLPAASAGIPRQRAVQRER
jgi:predicted amidohydrolase